MEEKERGGRGREKSVKGLSYNSGVEGGGGRTIGKELREEQMESQHDEKMERKVEKVEKAERRKRSW